jgi:hypothetical protein
VPGAVIEQAADNRHSWLWDLLDHRVGQKGALLIRILSLRDPTRATSPMQSGAVLQPPPTEMQLQNISACASRMSPRRNRRCLIDPVPETRASYSPDPRLMLQLVAEERSARSLRADQPVPLENGPPSQRLL